MGLAFLTLAAFLGGFGIAVVVCVLADRQDDYFDGEDYERKLDKRLKYAKAQKTKKASK